MHYLIIIPSAIVRLLAIGRTAWRASSRPPALRSIDRSSASQGKRVGLNSGLDAVMNIASVTPDVIVALGKAFRASKTLFSAIELGVFTALANGPRNLKMLRADLGIAERGARDFFDSLVALKLLERDEAGCYRNGPESATYLDHNKPTYIGGELNNFN